MTPAPLLRPVLLYDGECRLCRFTARCVVRLDRRQELGLLSLQDDAATPLLAALPASERYDTWRLARPDGALSGYGTGMRELVEIMRLTRLAWLLRRAPDRVLDTAYGVVARNGGRLGRLVPGGPAPRRYP